MHKILPDHRQDGNVAVGGIGNLARCGISAVSEIQTNTESALLGNVTLTETICCTRSCSCESHQ